MSLDGTIENITFPVEGYRGIGKGCVMWKNCNDHGICDYCAEKCICQEGFGSLEDLADNDLNISPDCSQRKYHYYTYVDSI
jgi:hypothetical protein